MPFFARELPSILVPAVHSLLLPFYSSSSTRGTARNNPGVTVFQGDMLTSFLLGTNKQTETDTEALSLSPLILGFPAQ